MRILHSIKGNECCNVVTVTIYIFIVNKYDFFLLFIVFNAGCSSGPCGDTDNYVCTDLNCKGEPIMSAKSKARITRSAREPIQSGQSSVYIKWISERG